MTPSMEAAHFVHGKPIKTLAAECGVSRSAFEKWTSGRYPCPRHKRQSVDRAFGAAVDWVQYDAECSALLRLDASAEAQKRPSEAKPPVSHPTPAKITQSAPAARSGAVDAFEELYGGCL